MGTMGVPIDSLFVVVPRRTPRPPRPMWRRPIPLWEWGALRLRANTRSEARAAFKRALGLARLLAGQPVRKVEEGGR